MKNIGRSFLRWLYIGILYAVFGIAIFFTMRTILSQNLPNSPFGYSLDSWLGNIYLMFFNTLLISLGLVLLWNVLFSRAFLGSRDIGRGVNILNAVLIGLHVVLSLGSIWFLLREGDSLTWAMALINGSMESFIALLLPILLIIPFVLATRWFAPEIISNQFSVFKRSRPYLGLRYY